MAASRHFREMRRTRSEVGEARCGVCVVRVERDAILNLTGR